MILRPTSHLGRRTLIRRMREAIINTVQDTAEDSKRYLHRSKRLTPKLASSSPTTHPPQPDQTPCLPFIWPINNIHLALISLEPWQLLPSRTSQPLFPDRHSPCRLLDLINWLTCPFPLLQKVSSVFSSHCRCGHGSPLSCLSTSQATRLLIPAADPVEMMRL